MMHARSGIVWDLDHTLYESSDEINAPWFIALAKLAVLRGFYPTQEMAYNAIYQSFLDFGHGLAQMTRDFGIDEKQFIKETLEVIGYEYDGLKLIEPCDITFDALVDHAHVPQVILTSAKREWACRVVERLGLETRFPSHAVITLEDADFQSKAASRVPFDRAAQVLGIDLPGLVMVDDNANNLMMAKDLGMATVMIAHGKVPEARPVHVDFIVNKAYHVFDLIHEGFLPWAVKLPS